MYEQVLGAIPMRLPISAFVSPLPSRATISINMSARSSEFVTARDSMGCDPLAGLYTRLKCTTSKHLALAYR